MEMTLPGWAAEVSVTPIQKPVTRSRRLSLHRHSASCSEGARVARRRVAAELHRSGPRAIPAAEARWPPLPPVRVHLRFDGPVPDLGSGQARSMIRCVRQSGPVGALPRPARVACTCSPRFHADRSPDGGRRGEVREGRGEHCSRRCGLAQRSMAGGDLPGRMSARRRARSRRSREGVPSPETRWIRAAMRGRGVHWSAATVEADASRVHVKAPGGEVLGAPGPT